MKRTDWQMDVDGDELLDENGEYIEADSNWQEAWMAVETVKGENAQFPTAGFGAVKRLRKRAGAAGVGETPERFARDLQIELESDGQDKPEIMVNMIVSALQFTAGVE